MSRSLEVYDVLRKHLHEEAAKVIAEVLPASDQLATKADIETLRAEIYRWMLTFFATLMLGMGGMITAIVLKA